MYGLHFIEKMSYRRIAVLLNAEGVPLPNGGFGWTKSSVVRVMSTVVAIDVPTMDVILTENSEVAPYEGFYERIREAALSPEESANLLTN